MPCDEGCRTAVFGKTERTVGWEGNGDPVMTGLLRHCTRGNPQRTDRPGLPPLTHSFTLDLVWWGEDKAAVRDALEAARDHARQELRLTVKSPVRVGQSRHGLSFCGYRILPGRLLLSRRRKRRYAECRRRWEQAYLVGEIDALKLQAGYAAAYAITAHADAAAWRREELRRHPLAPELCEL